MQRIQQVFDELSESTFHGVPAEKFASGGREQLGFLLDAGICPDSKLLDIGCGVLRAGYWIIHFLNEGCYYGIEPHEGRLKIGTEKILEPDILAHRKPRFDLNENFDTSVFGKKFDFFLAYSIWTHATKDQIRVMLDGFGRDTKEDAVFLTSYLPGGWRWPDYKGSKWNGTSHKSDVAGCIGHRTSWIKNECAQRGLTMRKLGKDKTHLQSWLEIKHRK